MLSCERRINSTPGITIYFIELNTTKYYHMYYLVVYTITCNILVFIFSDYFSDFRSNFNNSFYSYFSQIIKKNMIYTVDRSIKSSIKYTNNSNH